MAMGAGGLPLLALASVTQRSQKKGYALVAVILLMVALQGCGRAITPRDRLQTYYNDRFDFELAYPRGWSAAPSPDNRDGQAFYFPDNQLIEIRAWGSYPSVLAGNHAPEAAEGANFTTRQGLSGRLQVDIGPEVSTMTLRLERDRILYTWQAQAPSEDFPEYYPLFQSLAKQYYLPSKD